MDFSQRQVEKELEELKDRRRYRKGQVSAVVLRLFLIFAVLLAVIVAVPMLRTLRSTFGSGSVGTSISASSSPSQVYDRKGEWICEVPADIRSEDVSYDAFPLDLINAVITVQEPGFWNARGVDLNELAGQAIDLMNGRTDASRYSIAEQCVLNDTRPDTDLSFQARVQSAVRLKSQAYRLSEEIGKEGILERYLNGLYFGNGVTGATAASERYFGKDLGSLSLPECVLLAAVAADPLRYNPISCQEDLRVEIRNILYAMEEGGYLTEGQADSAAAEDPVSEILTVPSESERYASDTWPDFVMEALAQVEKDYAAEYGLTPTQAHQLVSSGGCSITLTLDPEIQQTVDREIRRAAGYTDEDGSLVRGLTLAYRLVVRHADGTVDSYSESDLVEYYRSTRNQPAFRNYFTSSTDLRSAVRTFRDAVASASDTVTDEVISQVPEPQASCVLTDPASGEVLALSGGRNDLSGQNLTNRASQVRVQPGSTFQILADYLPAIDVGGRTLASVFYDSPYSVGDLQVVNWWGNTYLGYNNIRQAIQYSMNVIAMKCMTSTVSPSQSYDYLTGLGFAGLDVSDKTSLLALGSLSRGVTNLELTSAYASFANDGVYNAPVLYRKVCGSDGEILLQPQRQSSRVMKSSTAALLTSAMEDAVDGENHLASYGLTSTGSSCRIPGWPVAGKSGTSLNSTDLWFVGYTPLYACGVWAGYDSGRTVSATSDFHKRIWQRIMAAVHEDRDAEEFHFTDTLETAEICSKSGQLAVDGVCNADDSNAVVYDEVFAPGTAPTDYCTRHYTLQICRASGRPATLWCPADEVTTKVYMRISDADLQSGADTPDLNWLAPAPLTACTIHTADTAETAADPWDGVPMESLEEALPLDTEEETAASDSAP